MIEVVFVSYLPSTPSDNASRLAQLVEKKLENYYKTDEQSQIKVKSELKYLFLKNKQFMEDVLSVALTKIGFICLLTQVIGIKLFVHKPLPRGSNLCGISVCK